MRQFLAHTLDWYHPLVKEYNSLFFVEVCAKIQKENEVKKEKTEKLYKVYDDVLRTGIACIILYKLNCCIYDEN